VLAYLKAGSDMDKEVAAVWVSVARMEKHRAHTVGAMTDQLVAITSLIEGLIENDLDAATIRALHSQNQDDMADRVDALQVWTLDSLICAHRSGHNFECTDVTMGKEQPIYRFECKDCHLAYAVLDSKLTKKEAAIAKAFVTDQLKQATKVVKQHLPTGKKKRVK